MAIFPKFSPTTVMRELTIFLLAIFLVPMFLPLLVVLYIFSLIAQKFAILLAKIFRSDLSHILAEPGVMFSLEHIYRRPKVNAVCYYICDGTVPLAHLRRQFEQRIINYCDDHGNLKYRKLRQTWTQFSGFMFWKWERNFDLNNHVRMYDYTAPELALPSPCTENDLKRVARTLISKPYVKGRSPWEIMVIPDYEYVDSSDGKTRIGCVLTLRIHHGLADGLSIAKMWYQLVDQEFIFPATTFPQLSLPMKALQFTTQVLKFPYDLAQLMVLSRDGPHSWHVMDKKLSRSYHVFASDRIPTSIIKTIKNKYRVGYNTVVYAVTAGAVSRLMREAGQEVPKVITCMVPYPLANHPGGLVNHATISWFRCCPSISKPALRLKEIAAEIGDPRSLPTVTTSCHWLVKLIVALPVPILRVFHGGHYSLAMTSFPGAERPLEVMEGVRMVDVITAGGVGPGTLGAMAQCQSVGGYQRMVLTVDELIFQDYKVPLDFNELVNEEINELLAGEVA